MGSVTYPTLEHVAMEARPYPTHVLEGAETGLVLFAAAFLGHNDAIHFAEAGIRTTCVDTDESRLHEMKALYPDEWSFVAADAWAFAEAARDMDTSWDVVSLDPFTGDAMERVLADLDLWAAIADRALVVGCPLSSKARNPFGAWYFAGQYERSEVAAWIAWRRA